MNQAKPTVEGSPSGRRMAAAERDLLLRIGAVSSILGVVTIFVADAFHGGHDPANLEAALSEYAANANWEVVHIGQFLGYALVLGALVALYRSIGERRGAALAQLGFVTALVATATYAANQAVDGVAIKFVADEWVSAPASEKANALRVAEAVRHVEIGLSSFSELILGSALLLFGLAIALGDLYPRLLGWAAMAVGAGWVALGLLVARDGFTHLDLTMWVSVLLALWVLVLAVFLWRKAGKSNGP